MHDLLDLTGLLYRAAAEPPLWEEVAERLRQVFDGRVAVVLVRGAGLFDIRFVALAGLTRAAWDDYVDRWGPRDPHLPAAMQLATGEAMLSHEVLDPAELKATAFYRELYGPWGLLWCAAGVVERSEDVFAVMAVHREAGKPAFGAEERAMLEALLPHVRHALRLQGTLGRLRTERDLWQQLVERLDLPVLLLGPDGRLLDANPAGTRALASGRPLALVRGKLVAADPAQSRRLADLLRQGDAHATVEIADEDGRPHRLTVLQPEAPAPDGAAPVRLLVIGTPTAMGPRPAPTAALSAMELKVAQLLAGGAAPKEIAARLGLGYETVRSHLKRAMAKTGTRRQAELVGWMLNGGSRPR